MKKTIVLFVLFLSCNLFAQEFDTKPMFSKFRFSVLGGANFNTKSILGGALQLGVKTNITPEINMKISVGYFNVFERKEYLIKSYSFFNIDNIEGYQLNTYSINQLRYDIFPINLGIEYTILKDDFSPFGIFEIGYNFYSKEEQIAKSTGGKIFDNKNEIPNEYLNSAPNTLTGSSFGMGLGLGIKYKITSSLDLNIRYIYRYNDSIINNDQILLGITF